MITIAESYIQGVSTRRMEVLVKGFGLDSLSASEVSRICKILDEKVEEFLKKPIETKIRYLLVDATYFKGMLLRKDVGKKGLLFGDRYD